MFIPRHETEVLQEKLNKAINEGVGSTILISGEPGIGKTTLIKNFMDNCDKTSEKNVLTAVGSCLDMDGVSRGFLPWREVLIELDADKAAGKDEEKKTNFKKIVKTVFDEAGSQWLEAIPVIGDISSAIFETAKSVKKDEIIDVETGDSKKLALKDRLKNVAKECTGEWLNVIPVVGNLSAAIYKTTTAIQKSKQVTYSQNQQDFFIRVMSRFRELAETNPVIIYIDDLQWADISSMNLFFYLSKNLKDSPYPMVLIGSFRPQDVKDGRLNPISGEMERHPWEEKMNNLKRYDAIQLIEISYLNQSQIASYLDLQFPKNEFSQKFKNEIVDLTKGNSLFVRELLLNLQERKIIFQKDGVFFADETLDLSALPQTVTGIIEERFQRLSEDLQEVLQIASAQGSDFSLELIASILEVNNFKLGKKMNTLQQKYSLVLKSETVYDKLKKIYNFTHNLVQKYIYYQMTEDFRMDLHSALVETFEEFFEGDEIYKVAEPYSYHFGVANGIIDGNGKLVLEQNKVSDDILNKYLEFQEKLARELQTNYQNEEAINKYLELVDIHRIRKDKYSEIKATQKLGHIYHLIGQNEKATLAYESCLKESEKNSFIKLTGYSLLFLGEINFYQGDYVKAKGKFEKALKIFEELGDKRGTSKAIGSLGNVYFQKSDYIKAMECFEKQLKISEELGNKRGISLSVGNMGVVYANKGDYIKAMECYEKSLKIYEELGDKRGISLSVGNMGVVYENQVNYIKAMECYEKSLKIYEELGDKRGISVAVESMGNVYFKKGDYIKAMECFEKALTIREELGDKSGISVAVGYMGNVYSKKGDYIKAMECFEKSLKICEELGDKSGISFAVGSMGNICKERGNYKNSMKYYDRAIAISEELGIKFFLYSQLIDKAELLFLLKEFKKAQKFNAEGLSIAQEISSKEYTSKGKILTEKINFALGDKENSPKLLQKMIAETEDKEEVATLNYELWKMNQGEKYKIEAQKCYQELYSKTPKFEYKQRIEELEK